MNNKDVIRDILKRDNQLSQVKKIIKCHSKGNKGFAIAIDGNWGCGKTYFLKMLEAEYAIDDYVFYYDAWSNNYYDEPVIGLLDCLRQGLNEINKNKNACTAIISSALNIITNFFDLALESKIGIKPIKTIKEVRKYISRKTKESEIGDEFNPYSEISNAKRTIIKSINKLNESNKKIIVFVDELDRCDPRYAMKVLERIHHITTNANVVSIIAIDKKQMHKSIQSVYSGNKEDKGAAEFYLRKIVDITYELGNGVFDPSKRTAVFGELESLFLKCDEKFIKEKELIDFEARLFNEIEIRNIERLIQQTTIYHKIVFGEEKVSPAIMCGELIIGWAALHIDNKKELLSKMSSEYDSSSDNNGIYHYVRDNMSGYIRASQMFDDRPHLDVVEMASLLFYIIKCANRKTITVGFNNQTALKNSDISNLIDKFLPLIINSNC